MSNNELKFYNSTEIWKQEPSVKQLTMVNDVLNLVPKDVKKILDIGCGNGLITNSLPQDIYVCGLDISEEALKYVQREKIVGSIENLPFEDEEIDLVLSTDTIEHLPPEVLENGICEIQRVASKYVLIAVPYKENLEYAQTKCKKCSTRFHVNWHIHSFDVQKIYKLFDEDKFRLRKISFSGDPWPYYFQSIDEVERLLNNTYVNWDEAICPTCGTLQNNKISNELKLPLSKYKDEYFTDNINQFIYRDPTKNEVILLFEKILENKEQDKEGNTASFFVETTNENLGEAVPVIEIVKKRKMDIIVGSAIQKKSYTEKYYPYPYVLVNETVNWGEIEKIDNKLVRKYVNKKTTFNHAVFVIPKFSNATFEITLSYKDLSKVPLIVQVYDKNISYYPLGELESKNDGKWKCTTFTVPESISSTEEGIIFDLVPKEESQDLNYYFDAILVENSYIASSELLFDEIVSEEEGTCFEYNVNLQEFIDNQYILRINNLTDEALQMGIKNSDTTIYIQGEPLYENITEINIYPWLTNDEYIAKKIGLKPKSVKVENMHIENLFEEGINHNVVEALAPEILKCEIANINLKNYLNKKIENLDNLYKVQIANLNDEKNVNFTMYEKAVLQIGDLNLKNDKLANEKEDINQKNMQVEEKYNSSQDECLKYSDLITELKSRLAEQEKMNEEQKQTIVKLKNVTITDIIFKKGGRR